MSRYIIFTNTGPYLNTDVSLNKPYQVIEVVDWDWEAGAKEIRFLDDASHQRNWNNRRVDYILFDEEQLPLMGVLFT